MRTNDVPASISPRRAARGAALAAVAAVATLLLAGCPNPKPFDTANECAKIENNCGRCASRGGCGWCNGKCIPSDDARCSTTLVKDSGKCADATVH